VPDNGETAQSYLVETGISYTVEGDHMVQVGGVGKRFYVADEGMSQDEAVAFCEGLEEGGFAWTLARLQELRAMSRCCRTRPEQSERCSTVDICFLDGPCVAVEDCRGCGEPPSSDGCWWDPSFVGECGAYWSLPQSSCGLAFDFGISEITALPDGERAGVICTVVP
jgi:hypothetical protein